ncbi:MAG: Uma2 family endonuclease [Calothrix sp. FI2-JRJ7]|nr:Uma2 family endonuclease [Calothrix sp. FI2-JRJ7]
MLISQQQFYTFEEYLKLEDAADSKSEYIYGQIIPIAGVSTNHNDIALNFGAELNFAFKRQDYRVYINEVKLWIPKMLINTYPDVMVIAGEPEYYNQRTDIITNPQIIIEVLSKSTQAYDKEGKFEAYRTIKTFQEYLLIDPTRIHIEHYHKTGKKNWSFREYDKEDKSITLNSVTFEIAIPDLYNKVQLDNIAITPDES